MTKKELEAALATEKAAVAMYMEERTRLYTDNESLRNDLRKEQTAHSFTKDALEQMEKAKKTAERVVADWRHQETTFSQALTRTDESLKISQANNTRLHKKLKHLGNVINALREYTEDNNT